ncbi:MAG: S8 family serine peptidase, partial [Candidatus Aminicenantes bacterium]|nr:S8 family serine peptidase [Candidatus Aminicenantes bacterium]
VYELVDGTSFSAPLVAGAAALVLEANPTWTNRDIMDAIKATAGRANDPNNEFGWGIVNAAAAADYSLKGFYAPENFAVKKLINDYLFFVQYVEKLSWTANPRNTVPIKSYRIYTRHAHLADQPFELLTEVDGQTFSVERRGLLPDEEYLYKITSVDESGQESEPSFAR